MSPTLSRTSSHSLALVALFAALMAVLGLIPKIDLPGGVPITAQSLGVMLAGCLLGPKRGFQAIALFLVAVAIGLPLLAGGRGGLGPFTSPSAGYLFGYAASAFVIGLVMASLPRATSATKTAINAFIASVVGGILFLHAAGIAGLMVLAKMPFNEALMIDVAFVPGDLIKSVLCALVVHTVARALPDWPFAGRNR
ncbi:MAG: biotin transporter BioY [Lautropia sp.]|nr:biotin transporter BioY [Lautropia sp.]